jgi:cobalt-zinc-cadmium efflux system protein
MAADALVSAGVVVAGGLTPCFGWNWLDPVVSRLIAAVIEHATLQVVKAPFTESCGGLGPSA